MISSRMHMPMRGLWFSCMHACIHACARRCLAANATLTEVNLGRNKLDSSVGEAMFAALTQHHLSVLGRVDLSINFLGSRQVSALRELERRRAPAHPPLRRPLAIAL